MLQGVLLLAADEAAESSKVPFYVAGGAFAVWAVVLFAVGMRSASFPGGKGGQRGVVVVTAVLMVAAMATAVITA
jgi:hypothetical protein